MELSAGAVRPGVKHLSSRMTPMIAASARSGCALGQLVVLGAGASPLATSFVPLNKLSVHAAAGPASLAHFLGPPNRLLIDKEAYSKLSLKKYSPTAAR